jgi:1-deoxy-D-xylulose-5-phosphate reductoisomerase
MTSRPGAATQRRVIILGSTGSIGVSALRVLEHLAAERLAAFQVVALAAGRNAPMLARQAERYGVRQVAVGDEDCAESLTGLDRVYAGPDAARQLVEAVAEPGDLVLGAMVGSAGLPATIAAIERGCDIALANKETLVAAGELVMPLVRAKGVNLLPVDSEHSAVAQCLRGEKDPDEIRRIVLTASGGPFRTWPKERIDRATVEEALEHPTWDMGRKITVDSASMMNKALEVLEAHWLFDLPPEKIEVIVHRQSLIHSFVEFRDGSIVAQLGPPDMKTPIQCALTWPRRLAGCGRTLDWATLSRMDFEPVDHARFPALTLGWEAIGRGGAAGAILNAANEAAVEAFLDRRIPFGRIAELVSEALTTVPCGPVRTLQDVLSADAAARAFVGKTVAARAGQSAKEAPTTSPPSH